ncbi:DEAD/DEAH box helicase [Thalassobacillus sp. CUG 92003]|uniref:DEAD/DEAH box helicase n=1 Tax=Thalassobacillus sp. CUG 92003 TaxID=2736641 RepID=UPI00351A1D26
MSSLPNTPDSSALCPLSGKLLLKHELHYPDEQIHQWLNEGAVTHISSIEKTLTGRRCMRCGNTKHYLFAEMPCHACQSTCYYCRNCIQMGRVLACQPLYYGASATSYPEHPEPCEWEGSLSRFQLDAATRITAAMASERERLLVWAVCGAGKTEMLFPGLTQALSQGKRICLATPRTDVVRELLPRMKAAFPGVSLEGLYGDSPDKAGDAQLIIATTHQLYRYAYCFDVVVIDEIDAFPFHADPSLNYAAKRAAKATASFIYLTATPRRKQKWAIAFRQLPVVFVARRFHGYPLPVPQLKMIASLRRQLKAGQLPNVIAQHIASQQQRGTRQLLLFVPTIQLAEMLTDLLAAHYSSITSVHSKDPDREHKIQQFRNREKSLLMTTTILERGVTFPSVDVFVLDAGHDVFDEAALVQMAGRAGRSPDDPCGDVIFYHAGKRNAMVDAVAAIKRMNRIGSTL